MYTCMHTLRVGKTSSTIYLGFHLKLLKSILSLMEGCCCLVAWVLLAEDPGWLAAVAWLFLTAASSLALSAGEEFTMPRNACGCLGPIWVIFCNTCSWIARWCLGADRSTEGESSRTETKRGRSRPIISCSVHTIKVIKWIWNQSLVTHVLYST